MVNLFRMDLYRMLRVKSFYICLALTFALALATAPLTKLLYSLSTMLGVETATEEKAPELDEQQFLLALAGSGIDEDTDISTLEPEKVAAILTDAGVSGDVTKADPDSTLGVFLTEWGGDMEALKKEMQKSSDSKKGFPSEQQLSGIIGEPFPILGLMLVLLSVCAFFYADSENGYIKNIAGQMPMKGFTILSKFLASIVHSLVFIAAGIAGNVIGTLLVQRIVADAAVADSIRIMCLKLLLLQSICAILLLVVSTFRNKSLGMILAVLFGMGLTSLIYLGINSGLQQIFGKDIDISKYMPDSVMSDNPLETVKAILVSLVTTGIFLPLAIRIFDRKDVK